MPAVPTKASLVKVPKGVTIWKGQAEGTNGGKEVDYRFKLMVF